MGTAMLILLIVLVSELGLTGSAADWLATLSNSVVAIMAFFAARRWLPQLTTQEGYKLAIRLVNEEILTLDENNPFKQHVHGVVQEFTGLRRPEKVARGESVLNKLSKVLTSANERFRAIRKLEKQMATYGLAPTPDREDAFNCMIKGLGGFISAAESERVLLTAYLRGTTSSQGIDDLLKLDHYGLINRMNGGEAWTDLSEECLQDLNRSWDKMIENQKAFLGTNSQIGKLFIVRL